MKKVVFATAKVLIATMAFFCLMHGSLRVAGMIHAYKCPVCNNKAHVEKCRTLSFKEKGDFDAKEGCGYFWCPHYNGK